MFHVVLFQPEIPPNTGNIMRLCANIGARLHLIEPLGFQLEDRLLRRAGLDYREWVDVAVHPDIQAFRATAGLGTLYAVSTRGDRCYTAPAYQAGDAFLFGPETRGLPEDLLAAHRPGRLLRIPMQPGNRSLNLSNAVAVVLFEAWRQNGFLGSSLSCLESPGPVARPRAEPGFQPPGVDLSQTSSGLGSRSNKESVAARGEIPSKRTR